MASANPLSREEESRNLKRLLRLFASKQEDRIEDSEGCERTAPSQRHWDDTEEAFGHTQKGT